MCTKCDFGEKKNLNIRNLLETHWLIFIYMYHELLTTIAILNIFYFFIFRVVKHMKKDIKLNKLWTDYF